MSNNTSINITLTPGNGEIIRMDNISIIGMKLEMTWIYNSIKSNANFSHCRMIEFVK